MSETFLNTGKFAWEIVQANRPVVNVTSDYVNAIPEGARWEDLSPPAGTNYHTWEWLGPGLVLHDFSFTMQLSWTYGVRYRGGGAYISNAAVTVLNHDVGVGGYQISINCRIGNIDPASGSTPRAPIPNIPIDVSLSFTNWFYGGGGTNRFTIQGNGGSTSRWDGNSYEP
ncbi:MAG: hypothetical protein AB7L17_15280 [Ilumatobacteraceae bacterium]